MNWLRPWQLKSVRYGSEEPEQKAVIAAVSRLLYGVRRVNSNVYSNICYFLSSKGGEKTRNTNQAWGDISSEADTEWYPVKTAGIKRSN